MSIHLAVRKIYKFLTDSNYRFIVSAHRGYLRTMPAQQFLKKMYHFRTGKDLNLENPVTYTEKLQWLKLYDHRPEYTTMVDKYAAKQYVAEKIGEEYIIPLLGVWDRAEDIDFDTLPDRFVLKTTHDSGGIVVCKDKNTLDKAAAKELLEAHLKSNHWIKWREWAYKNVKPQIIAEAYMADADSVSSDGEEQLTDYKFFCFHGEPKMMFIATDRLSKTEVKFDFFDMEFRHLPFRNQHPNAEQPPKCPECFEKMKDLARKLSAGIPQVRVDFYNVGGQVYFGEYTIYHWAGLTRFTPDEWDYKIGEMFELPKKKRK